MGTGRHVRALERFVAGPEEGVAVEVEVEVDDVGSGLVRARFRAEVRDVTICWRGNECDACCYNVCG